MLPANLLESYVRISSAAVHLGIDWLLQSTLLIAVGLLAARVFRRNGAAVQSLIFRMTLAAVLACPIVPLLLGMAGMRSLNLNPVTDASAASSRPSYETADDRMAVDDAPIPENRVNFSERSDTADGETQAAAGSTVAHQPSAPQDSPGRVPVLGAVPAIYAPASLHILLAAAWFLGSSVLATRLLIGWRSVRQLRLSACPADTHAMEDCRRLAARMGVRAPQLLRSGFAASPLLMGILRPVVVLPEEENIQANDQEVLVHELAHLARGDQAWSLVGHIGAALLFYQPLMWLLVRRMMLAAEEVCDDYVLDLGFDRPVYAGRLVDVAERYQPARACTVGMVSLRFEVSRRVVRILDSSRQLSTRTSRRARIVIGAATLVAAVLAGALSVGDRAVAASDAHESQPAVAPSASQARRGRRYLVHDREGFGGDCDAASGGSDTARTGRIGKTLGADEPLSRRNPGGRSAANHGVDADRSDTFRPD